MIFTTVSLNSTLKVISNGIQQAYLTNNINLTDFGGVPNGRGWGATLPKWAQMGLLLVFMILRPILLNSMQKL